MRSLNSVYCCSVSVCSPRSVMHGVTAFIFVPHVLVGIVIIAVRIFFLAPLQAAGTELDSEMTCVGLSDGISVLWNYWIHIHTRPLKNLF